nr:esterase lipase superfamily protein [Pithovirus mammoth]
MDEEWLWMDFMTVDGNFSDEEETKTKQFFGIEENSDSILSSARSVWQLVIQNGPRIIHFQKGIAFQVNLNDRYYVVYVPFQCLKEEKVPLLIFLHGLMSSAWYCALKRTHLIELANQNSFIVIFGQANGKFLESGPIREKWGGISFGDTYWNILDTKIDFNYLNSVTNLEGEICKGSGETDSLNIKLKDIRNKIDKNRIYLWGYSNGAMFSCLSGLTFGRDKFAGICSMMGGWPGKGGYDEQQLLQILDQNPRPTKVMIVTGELDEYKEASIEAEKLFKKKGFNQAQLIILEGQDHHYVERLEGQIWTFLSSDF